MATKRSATKSSKKHEHHGVGPHFLDSVLARRLFPIGSKVRITSDKMSKYSGKTGFVVGHEDAGPNEMPLIGVRFHPRLRGGPVEEGFYEYELTLLPSRKKR